MDKYLIKSLNLITQVIEETTWEFPSFKELSTIAIDFESEKAITEFVNELGIKRKSDPKMNNVVYMIVPSYIKIVGITRL